MEGDRIQCVARLRLDPASRIHSGLARLLVDLDHAIRVAMVGRHDQRAAQPLDHGHQASDLQVDGFDGLNRGGMMAGMSDHIPVGVVHASMAIATGRELFDQPIGDFGRLHPRAFLEGLRIRGDLDIGLEFRVESTTSIAVPEIGHVSEFLGLADRELAVPGPSDVLAERSIDRWGFHEVVRGHPKIAIVFHHPDVKDIGARTPIKILEVLGLEGFGDLDGTITAEIEEDDAIAIDDPTDRCRISGHHHELRQ